MKIMSRYFIFFIVAVISFTRCNFKKISAVSITNENGKECYLVLQANNIKDTIGPVAAGEKKKHTWDFTNIEKKDGSFTIYLLNENKQFLQVYEHGYFEKGELYNYMDFIIRGNEIVAKIGN
jgi:hypothetical protein